MQHFYAVDNIAELKELDPQVAMHVIASGYWKPGDGGGGVFHWDPASEQAADDGHVFSTGKQRGRWVRQESGIIDVRQFGARGDGSAAGKMIQAALNRAQGGGSVYLPSGRYLLSEPLRVPQGVHLFGDGLFSDLHYEGPPASGCLMSNNAKVSQAMAFSRLNILLHRERTWGIDLRGMSFGRFDQLSIHMRKENTSGFYGPGDGQSPYYNLFTACHVSGHGDHKGNNCVGFDFWHDEGGRQSANANHVVGGHINTCQIAVRCQGTGNVFSGQVLEMVDTGYEFSLPPDRLNDISKGTTNDVFGCYTEYVDTVIRSTHASCFVTAELTLVTGYKQVFEGDDNNSIVITSHDGALAASRSFINRRIDSRQSFDVK
ncbi:MAG: glycosyl hydrolase family 28-related protein [Pirellulaceae bacterium]